MSFQNHPPPYTTPSSFIALPRPGLTSASVGVLPVEAAKQTQVLGQREITKYTMERRTSIDSEDSVAVQKHSAQAYEHTARSPLRNAFDSVKRKMLYCPTSDRVTFSSSDSREKESNGGREGNDGGKQKSKKDTKNATLRRLGQAWGGGEGDDTGKQTVKAKKDMKLHDTLLG